MLVIAEKESYVMFYLLIPAVEFLIFFLVFFAGFRVYRLYSTANIRPDMPDMPDMPNIKGTINKEVQETHLPRKKPNAVLDDYIGDFF
jgi:hypothetical protein